MALLYINSPRISLGQTRTGQELVFSLWYGRRQGNHRENLPSYKGIEREGYFSSWLAGYRQARL